MTAHDTSSADYQRRATRTPDIPTDPTYLPTLARRLVDGDAWHDIALEHDTIVARLHEQVRDAVQPHILAIVQAEQPLPSHRRHGTRAAYVVDRCRCEACRYAIVVYERARERKTRRGLVPYVDAQPVRGHLAMLSTEGIGWKRAARLAGVHTSVVHKIIYGAPDRNMGPSQRVRRRTAAAILTVKPTLDVIADGAYIPADATWALINWLLDKGATKAWIGRQIGQHGGALQLGRAQVTGANAKAIRRLVDDVRAGRVQIEGRRSRWDTREDKAA
jgi:hypothetical protein